MHQPAKRGSGLQAGAGRAVAQRGQCMPSHCQECAGRSAEQRGIDHRKIAAKNAY